MSFYIDKLNKIKIMTIEELKEERVELQNNRVDISDQLLEARLNYYSKGKDKEESKQWYISANKAYSMYGKLIRYVDLEISKRKQELGLLTKNDKAIMRNFMADEIKKFLNYVEHDCVMSPRVKDVKILINKLGWNTEFKEFDLDSLEKKQGDKLTQKP